MARRSTTASWPGTSSSSTPHPGTWRSLTRSTGTSSPGRRAERALPRVLQRLQRRHRLRAQGPPHVAVPHRVPLEVLGVTGVPRPCVRRTAVPPLAGAPPRPAVSPRRPLRSMGHRAAGRQAGRLRTPVSPVRAQGRLRLQAHRRQPIHDVKLYTTTFGRAAEAPGRPEHRASGRHAPRLRTWAFRGTNPEPRTTTSTTAGSRSAARMESSMTTKLYAQAYNNKQANSGWEQAEQQSQASRQQQGTSLRLRCLRFR